MRQSASDKNNDHFRTDHLRDDIKGRSVRGGAVTMASQVVKFGLNLGANVILARLLTPGDYGIAGMVTTITLFVGFFKDLGLSTATVQKEEITHEQVSTLFWVNLLLGTVTALVVVVIAPIAAWFYKEPRLIWITIVTSIGFIFSSLGVQHGALLSRQMRFSTLVVIDITVTALSFVVGVILAMLGFRYWALVLYPLAASLLYTLAYWMVCSWRPGLPKRKIGMRSLLVFGSNVTGSNVLAFFARNTDNILIGRVWGAQQLGLYSKAYQLLMLPLVRINAPIAAVTIPSLSRLQSDPKEFCQHYLNAISIVAFLCLPLMSFLVVASEEVIQLFLGNQWTAASTIFRFLAISALVQPIYETNSWLHIATGRTDRMVKWGLFSLPIITGAFCLGLPYGADGVALSYAIAMLLLAIPCMKFAIQGTSITLLDLGRSLVEPLVASLLAGLGAWGVKWAIGEDVSLLILLISTGSVAAVIYLSTMFYAFGKKEFYLKFFQKIRSKSK
jgi:PST family polysaccharide transporter